MSTSQAVAAKDPKIRQARKVVEQLFGWHKPRDFAVRFWDGSTWEPDAGQDTKFTIVLKHVGSLRRMFWPPNDLAVGEAYLYGDIDIEGDLIAYTAMLRKMALRERTTGQKMSLGYKLWSLPRDDRKREMGRGPVQLDGTPQSPERAKKAISYHYDLSNDFFGKFLGDRMTYTSAVFDSPDEDLDAAQDRKHDLICRKLNLKEGERLLDIGCGWGGMVIYAAKHYGVHATGVTLSQRQAEYAQERIKAEGLEDRCKVEYRDYREVPEDQLYDKISTLEVLEHLGENQYPVYFGKAYRLLRPGGIIAIQQITLTGPNPLLKWRKFIRAYIFPDGELTPVSATQREAEKAGFEVRDVASYRESYAITLRKWLKTLHEKRDECLALVDEPSYRAFLIYIAGAAAGYECNMYNVHQTVVIKAHPDGKSDLPLTRSEWLGQTF